jgi:hypothetical protein
MVWQLVVQGDDVLFSFDDFTLDSGAASCARRQGCFDRPRVFDLWSISSKTAIAWSARTISLGRFGVVASSPDSTLDSRISAVHKALGDSGGQRLIRRSLARASGF